MEETWTRQEIEHAQEVVGVALDNKVKLAVHPGKEDKDKPMPSLVYRSFINAIAHVRAYGANKYGDTENWRGINDTVRRYLDAALRHLFAYAEGEYMDPESNLSHLSHAACSIMFIIEFLECDGASMGSSYHPGDRDDAQSE